MPANFLFFPFLYALFSLIFGPVLFPSLRLLFFAPYLIIVFYRRSRLVSLWHALAAGLIVDAFSSHAFFGITSLNYCLVAFFLYGQTRNFFEDKLSTLPFMTFLFSFLSSSFQAILLNFFGYTFPLSLLWVFTDLFLMPFLDAAYGCLLFSLPFYLYKKIARIFAFKRSIPK